MVPDPSETHPLATLPSNLKEKPQAQRTCGQFAKASMAMQKGHSQEARKKLEKKQAVWISRLTSFFRASFSVKIFITGLYNWTDFMSSAPMRQEQVKSR
jgi:hypothetical protein